MTNYQRALDEVGHQSFDEQGRRLTVDAIAERMGVRASNLRKALSAYDDAHPLNAAKVVPLTLTTKNLALVRYFAEACGCVLIELPKASVEHADVVAHAGESATSFGGVLANAGLALADGRVEKREAQDFRAHVNKHITVLLAMAEAMDIKAGIAPPPLRAVEGGQR